MFNKLFSCLGPKNSGLSRMKSGSAKIRCCTKRPYHPKRCTKRPYQIPKTLHKTPLSLQKSCAKRSTFSCSRTRCCTKRP